MEGLAAAREDAEARARRVGELEAQVGGLRAELQEAEQRVRGSAEGQKASKAALEAAIFLLLSVTDLQALTDALPRALRCLLPLDSLDFLLEFVPEDPRVANADITLDSQSISLCSPTADAWSLGMMREAVQGGDPAVRGVDAADLLQAAHSSGTPSSRLLVPLALKGLAEGSLKVLGVLLLERGAGQGPFTEEEVRLLARWAPILAGFLVRLGQEQARARRLDPRKAVQGLLCEATKLLGAASEGAAEDVCEAFERGVAALMGGGDARPRPTLFLLDTQRRVLVGSNQEVAPVGVGALGRAVASGEPLRDAGALYVPVGPPQGPPLGVVRVEGALSRDTEGLEAVRALGQALPPALHQARALRSALEGMRDASTAVGALQEQLEAAQDEACAELAARVRAEEALGALGKLLGALRSEGALLALFPAVEAAAKAVGMADDAALILATDSELDVGGREEGMWTLWPQGAGRERCRVRVAQGRGCVEGEALERGGVLVVSDGPAAHGEQQLDVRQTWLHARRGAGGPGREQGQGGEEGTTAVMVPVGGGEGEGGPCGVIELLRPAGPLESAEEAALLALSRATSTLLSRLRAELRLAKAANEQSMLRGALDDQRRRTRRVAEDAERDKALASLVLRLLAAPDLAASIEAARQFLVEALGAEQVAVRWVRKQGPWVPDDMQTAGVCVCPTCLCTTHFFLRHNPPLAVDIPTVWTRSCWVSSQGKILRCR
jgi:hypothetical protein